MNCKDLAHDKTIVIIDDTINDKKLLAYWNNGPNRAWKEVKDLNIIKEIGYEDYSKGRGISWGHYLF